MSKAIVNRTPYPFPFPSSNISLPLPNTRGRLPSLQASRLRSMILDAHTDPTKILAHVCSYDALTSKLCEDAGFPLVFLAGYAMASSLALPDTGYIAFQEVAAKIQEVVRVVDVPVLADGDTGYGGPMNVRRTVEGCVLHLTGFGFVSVGGWNRWLILFYVLGSHMLALQGS